MRIDLQPAYLLHSRKVSDSRLIVDFMTRDYGLLSAMARAPTKKQSPFALFRPVVISWLGNKELKTLTHHELAAVTMPVLQGQPLFCGFYLNELLIRLLNKGDGSTSLYEAYQYALLHLPSAVSPEPLLRCFERLLLDEAGFAIDWHCDITGCAIEPHYWYRLNPSAGFELINTQPLSQWCLDNRPPANTYEGDSILALASNQYHCASVQVAAKNIMRYLLASRLGGRALKSRELFASSLL
ncbi:DNA repair protein RecO [Marinagarivorans algicola]|uniref:DNA repair protein RecO n=1 Tax=Marinagarivorans algicola TaxID=1513270 RepID=UPI0006B49187|nr:DNA repair protein RecO [Marinagarivorans algicola]